MNDDYKHICRADTRAYVSRWGRVSRRSLVAFLAKWIDEPDARHAFIDQMLDAEVLIQTGDGIRVVWE